MIQMQISVSGKQLSVGDALRNHAASRLEDAVGKYFDRAIESHVVFSRESHSFRADISVHVGRDILVQGQGMAEDAHAAFDLALDHVAKRLRRSKRRRRDHQRKQRVSERDNILRANETVQPGRETTEDDGG
jgi:ribosomal subunit interface protein